MTRDDYFRRIGMLVRSGSVEKLMAAWNEPHRFYHNESHLQNLLTLVDARSRSLGVSVLETYVLTLLAFYHDAVYDPRRNDNEEKSAQMFLADKMCDDTIADRVVAGILATKDHTKPCGDPIVELFLDMDVNNLLTGTLSSLITDGINVFKEYQFYDWNDFRYGRIKFINEMAPWLIKRSGGKSSVMEYLEWMYFSWKPNIAVYPGSFYEFHNGHLDVLTKAERMFDKVIIACGINPDKPDGADKKAYFDRLKNDILPYHQVVAYNGFLHEFVKSLSYSVTIVKGLRNAADFDNEKLQLRYMEDMYPEVKIAYVIGSRETEHISSSGIKVIKAFGGSTEKYL